MFCFYLFLKHHNHVCLSILLDILDYLSNIIFSRKITECFSIFFHYKFLVYLHNLILTYKNPVSILSKKRDSYQKKESTF